MRVYPQETETKRLLNKEMQKQKEKDCCNGIILLKATIPRQEF